jgi:hypothetical protein
LKTEFLLGYWKLGWFFLYFAIKKKFKMGFLAAVVVWGVGSAAITLGAGPFVAGLFEISQAGVVAGSG